MVDTRTTIYRPQINELFLDILKLSKYALKLADINLVVYLGICKYLSIMELEHELMSNLFLSSKQAVQVNSAYAFWRVFFQASHASQA